MDSESLAFLEEEVVLADNRMNWGPAVSVLLGRPLPALTVQSGGGTRATETGLLAGARRTAASLEADCRRPTDEHDATWPRFLQKDSQQTETSQRTE